MSKPAAVVNTFMVDAGFIGLDAFQPNWKLEFAFLLTEITLKPIELAGIFVLWIAFLTILGSLSFAKTLDGWAIKNEKQKINK